MRTEAGETSVAATRQRRTVWGEWPILLSTWIAVGIALPVVIGVFASERRPDQTAALRESAVALVPVVVLIGLSVLVAKHLPPANRAARRAALWASFFAVLVIAVSLGR